MDLPPNKMYDIYKDEIWKELGPFDPDWFDALTAQSSTNEENVSDQDDLCANQEGNFKAPLDRTAVDSQLFSTPKVFRHSRLVSPQTEDEHSFTGEQEKETLPWTAAQSPCLFRTPKDGVRSAKCGGFQPDDSFDLLHTPQKSPVSYGKHISESLGAQIHHDMSWTSSLNTPPAVPSTLILSKKEESPCPVSISKDKTVVVSTPPSPHIQQFVRKLFPSLSNASRVEVVAHTKNEITPLHQGAVSPEPGQSPESHESPQSSLNQSDGVWKQKLPDAIEDGDIRRTVASVLDGAENVLSIFFTNSSSSLRKVKTDRIKRKHIISTKDHGCSSADVSSTNSAAFSVQRTADQEPGRLLSSPPMKTGDVGITQWSPLSLSDIPPCTVDSSCHDNTPFTHVKNSISTKQLRSDSDSGHLQKPPMKLPDSGFTKKKRTFVYTVGSSKSQVQGKETPTHMMNSSPGIPNTGQEVDVKQLVKPPGEEDCFSIGKNEIQKQGNLSEENHPPSVQAKLQDVDISQLCKDFAQDFSQMSGFSKLSKKAEDTPGNGFSPTACLSAMKLAKQRAMQINFKPDCEEASDRRHVSATHHNTSTNEGTISDSGFQSAVADNTHVTASSFILPSSEVSGQSQLWTGFKTDIHRTSPSTSTSKGNRHSDLGSILQETDTEAKLSSVINESQTLGLGNGSGLQIERTSIHLSRSAKGTADNINCIPVNGQVHGSLPEKTTVSLPSINASGFKTASNKGIHISSANLERAKQLFEETEGERTLRDEPTKCDQFSKDEINMSHGSEKNQPANQQLSSSEKTVDTSCHLTASQKADVTELCTLLEEADSQFEFTQFKMSEPKQRCQDNATSPLKADKELDPDFLSGIDFDDSFSSEAEKHLAVTEIHDKMTLVSVSKTKCETSNIPSEYDGLALSGAMKNKTSSSVHVSSPSKNISESSIMSAESKNLDEAGHNETSKLDNKHPLMLGVGFKTAGGNVLRVSKKCLSKARALFADLEENLVTSPESANKQSSQPDAETLLKRSVVNPPGYLLHLKQDNLKCSGCGTDAEERIQGCLSNTMEAASSDQQTTGIGETTKSLKNSRKEMTTLQSGFQMASGKEISISAKAMKEADAFFKDCDAMESNTGVSVKQAKSVEPLPGSVSPKETLSKCNKNVNKFENLNAGPVVSHMEVIQYNVEINNFPLNNTQALTNSASIHGNMPSTAQGLSSLSCKPSKNIYPPPISGLSNGGGFCTASGKKVAMSADALKKAEHLLNEFHTIEDTKKQLKQKEDALGTGQLTNQIQVSPPKNEGFRTASGKGVAISFAALKKAKLLLSECEGDEDKSSVKPKHSKMPVSAPPPRKSGFLAASGKPLALSAEALEKAKVLFSDISFSAEVSDAKINDNKRDSAENTEKMHCGFTTSGGVKVHVPQRLLKEKTLLEEFDDCSISAKAMQEADAFFENNDDITVQHKKCIAPVSASSSEKKNLLEFKQDQRMTNVCEPGNGHTQFENVNVGLVVNNYQTDKGVFKDTLDCNNEASLHGNPTLLCTTSKNSFSSASNELSKDGGFCTASGKKVSVSDDAMTKAKSLLNESATFEDTNKLKQKEEIFPLQTGGFHTASGKGVTISPAALKKAKSFFSTLSECEGVEDKNSVKPTNSRIPVPGPLPRTTGFLAATGKQVALSAEALEKAKSLFSDISFSAKISDTKINDNKQDNTENTEKLHCGFTTAAGVKVHVAQRSLLKAKSLLEEFDDGCISAKSMQDADAFFKDFDIVDANNSMSGKHNKNIAPVTPLIKQLKQRQETVPSQNGGFQTASGKGVTISPAALKKAKTFLSECERDEDKNGLIPTHSKIAVPGLSSRKSGFVAASGNPVAFSSEALQKAKALFSDISFNAEISDAKISDNKQDSAEEKKDCGFTTAGAAKVHVAQSGLLKAKTLQEEFDDGCISAKAMQEADAFFEDCNIMDAKNGMSEKYKKSIAPVTPLITQLKQKEENFQSQNGGFQTASGKGVTISPAALKKAKTLLNEYEGDEDKNGVKPKHSKIVDPGPPPRKSGFVAASGNPVVFSAKALQKAKALFSDISAESPLVSDTRNTDKQQDNTENTETMHCGFSTAGGAKVHVSQSSLLKAKNFLTEFDGKCYDSNPHSSQHDTNKSDPSKVKDVKRTCSLTTSRENNMPQIVKSLTSFQDTGHENEMRQNTSVPGCSYKDETHPGAFRSNQDKITPARVGNFHDCPEEEMSSLLDQTSSSEISKGKRHQELSVLNFHSLNLSGCTETQQRLLAQEALDCTKALLEDENLAGQSLSMTLENVPLQKDTKPSHSSAEEQKGLGKRPVEDPDMTGQPPLKRRLLEEFDRTVDGPGGSTLHPEKSCPNGVMKDRRVFKYSTSLQPNVTKPHRNGQNYVETVLQKTVPSQLPTPGESRSAHSKAPAFVPPFLKNAKTESRKNTAIKDNMRTPPAFVPPFKKHRTIVQESSSKPQEEETKHHHLLSSPFNSNTYVPPTKKTQSTIDSTCNKGQEDIQMVALADTTNDNLMNVQNIPASCGAEDSALEASRVEDTMSQSPDMFQNLHNVELARDMQDMRIRKKKRQTIRPLPGSLFLTKTSGVSRIPLKAAVNGKPPGRYTQKQLYGHGVHQHVYDITSETAESFRFELQLFIKREAFIDGGGVQLADGGWLIPSKDGTVGKEEFYRALCDTPGVDPKLISEGWLYNHYRWIVWKQASMERSFPETLGGLCLTPEQVLLQLKYRYDVEVDHSRRPALRKIMEKDDTAAKTIVLCVCGVISRGHSSNRQRASDIKTPQGADAKAENPSAVVWLTDGWYAIKAQLDEPLTAMLHKGRVAVGGKLIINGAQLVGSQDACSPLEAPESLMLKICANSSRPTRWDAKLGFYKDPRPFLLPVSCLYSSGGPVGCVDIIILRSYPIQWMERKPDGGVVFRSVRAEEKEARRYNSHKQKAMEILFAKIQAEFEKEDKGNNKAQHRRRTISRQDITSLQDGEELYEAVGDDPAYLEAHLSEQQLETLHTYRRSLMEKKQAELQDRYRQALQAAEDSEGSCPKRDITPVWRLCLADSMGQLDSVYQLNLWRPSSDLQSLLKEGCRYKVYNLTTSDVKKHGCSTTVQLTGTKKTQFQDLQASREWLSTRFQPRVSTHYVNLQNPEFQPLCGEVDLTGYVISIVDGQGFSPAFYLSDGKLNFVKVRCFSSFAQSGLDDLVKPRVLLALSNLQLRGQSTTPTPVVYAGDLTVFSTNPKEVHLHESLCHLRNLVQAQEGFFAAAEEELSRLIRSDGLGSISSPSLQTRTPVSAAIRKLDTITNETCQQPIRSFGSFTPVSRKPPAANSSTEKDPVSLKRKRALDFLSRIPSPPPLSLLGSVASPCVNKTFNPPRRSVTPSTSARKPVSSPVEDEWVNDEELAMIDTQALRFGDVL